MPSIIVKNSCIIVEDYEWGSCQRIENNFMMYDMVTHSNYYIGIWYDQDNRRLYLPRGIDIWFVEKYIGATAKVDHEYDPFDHIRDVYIKSLPRDDVQKESLRFMLGEGEYRDNKKRSQLSLNLNTGKGKTYVSIATIAYERIKSVIITYSNQWLQQWKACVQEYTDLDAKDVYQISGAQSIDMILSGKSIHSEHAIYLITHSTITSYAATYGWDKIGELFRKLKIGMKFYDEAHLNFENIAMIDFFTNTYRTYYITATPARSDERENKIYQLYMKNVPGITLFDKEEDPHTHYISIMFNSKPKAREISKMKNPYGLDINKYANYLVYRENFHMAIKVVLDMVFRMCGRNGRALFFFHTNEAIRIMYNWFEENYPEMKGLMSIYTSANDDKASAKNARIILSTAKSAGAAEDIRGLKVAVIMDEPFKSKVIARQILGRTRDDDTYLIEMVDLGFYNIKKWYYNKLPVYQKYAVDTREVLLTQTELEERAFAIEDARDFKIRPLAKTGDGPKECVRFDENLKGPRECVHFRYPLIN
jgi:hypothetical protein